MYDGRAAGAAGSAESIQILARRAGIILAVFAGLSAWYLKAAAWPWSAALAAAYVFFNLAFFRRRPPGVAELLVNVTLCAGLTLAQTEHSDILYQLLLLRIALRAGYRRIGRIVLIIAAIYCGAVVAVAASLEPPVVLRILHSLVGMAVVAYAAAYLNARIAKQADEDKQMLDLIKQNDRNYRLALTDSLTGLYNHRAYKEKIDGLAQYVLLVIDIDHFKKLNDAHGHLMGDKVLVGIGNIIKMSVRSGDLAFRYGGEEFVVVLPGTTAAIGLKIAERLRQKVAEWNFGGEAGRIPVTVSIGMATKKPGMSSHTVFEQADNAMYRAKQLGRNNVQAHGEPEAAAVKFGG